MRRQVPENAAISAGSSGRRRDCRAAGSPACCRHRVSARGFPDQRRLADTTPRRISPVCRRADRPAGRLCLLAQRCLAAAPVALVSNRLRARAQAGPSGPVASPARAELARSPRLTQPSARMRERSEVSFSCGENGRRARRFPTKPIFNPFADAGRGRSRLRICGNGSARNAPSGASGGARSG